VTGTAASQQERVQSIYCVSEKYFWKKAEKHKMDENDFWNVKIAIKWLQNGIQFSLFVDILYLQQTHGKRQERVIVVSYYNTSYCRFISKQWDWIEQWNWVWKDSIPLFEASWLARPFALACDIPWAMMMLYHQSCWMLDCWSWIPLSS
jgi:hypothetical protein